MALFDAHTNFAYSSVLVVPSPAISGTTLTLQNSDGAKMPAVPFNATIWPSALPPLKENAEIVRVTSRAGDVLTITRAQESSTARAIVSGDQFMAGMTVKTFTDIEAAIGQKTYVTVGTAAGADYVCDGVADNIEIQAALDSLSTMGGTILLRQGSYYMAASITLYSGIRILGEGPGRTIIVYDTSFTAGVDMFVVGSNLGTSSGHSVPGTYQNIEFSNIEFNLNSRGGTAFALYGCDTVVVQNCYIHDGIRYGMYFAGCNNMRIQNNSIVNLTVAGTYACIQLKGAYHTWVTNNYCYNNQAGSGNQGIDSHASDGVNARNGAYNHILDNHVELCGQGVNNEDNDTEILGNTIKDVAGQYGIGLRGTTTYPVQRLIIANNSVVGATTGNCVGISLANTASGASDIKIQNNYVSGIKSTSSSDGIVVSNATDVSVQGNTVKNSGRYGIYVRVNKTKVDGNQVYDDQVTPTQSLGIFVDDAVTDCYLGANVCHNNLADGIRLYNGNNNTKLSANELYNNGAYGLRFLGSANNNNCLVVGNYFSGNITAAVAVTGGSIGTNTEVGSNFGY